MVRGPRPGKIRVRRSRGEPLSLSSPPSADTRPGAGDHALLALRSSTAEAHQRVEDLLGLTSADLDRPRLLAVVARLSGFWGGAEQRLDEWAAEWPEPADALQWPLRRRSQLFADDLLLLGEAVRPPAATGLPATTSTAAALGVLYVLEGSSLGGQIINRGLAARGVADPLFGFQLSGLAPYGTATGPMWQGFRRFVVGWVDAGGPSAAMVDSAAATFAALESWCQCLRVGT